MLLMLEPTFKPAKKELWIKVRCSYYSYTVKPPNEGHIGTSYFVFEIVLFSEVKNVGALKSVLCREAVPFLGGSFIGGFIVL